MTTICTPSARLSIVSEFAFYLRWLVEHDEACQYPAHEQDRPKTDL